MRRGIPTSRPAIRRFAPVRSGFSLIEILVVLVILLIGILAILRLFPGGFLTIRRTGDATNAQALVAQQLDAQKNLASVADSILPAALGTDGSVIPLPDIDPNNLSDFTQDELDTDKQLYNNFPDVASENFYYYSDINRIRYVRGELVRIPVPTASAAKGYGSIYLLQFGPVYNKFGTDNNGQQTDSIKVYGAPLERTEQSSTGLPVLNSPSQYAIDYDKQKIAFYPSPIQRQFVVSYDYYESVNNGLPTIKSRLNAIITVPAQNSQTGEIEPIWQDFFSTPDNPQPANFLDFRRNYEVVSRKFKLIPIDTNTNRPNWSNDPYEYVWYNKNEPDTPESAVNSGVLAFNPRGHDYVETTTNGTQPLTARVDYLTYDNHVIREDRTVPSSSPYTVKLSLPFIQNYGDILTDGTQYIGMFRFKNTGRSDSATPDLLIYNTNTGDKIGAAIGGGIEQIDPQEVDFDIDYRTGTLVLKPTAEQEPFIKNATIRLFYRAQGDWGMQVQKANAQYLRAFQPSDITYNSYFYPLDGDTSGAIPTRLYFRLSEAGKTVVLGEYFVKKKGAQNQIARYANEAYHINDNPALYQTLGTNTKFTFIDIAEQHPEAVANQENWVWSDDATGQGVARVQGSSVKSRVIWKNGERWRTVDNDTFLQQAEGR